MKRTSEPTARGGYQGLETTTRDLLDLDLNSGQLKAFAWYAKELQEWNRRINLTAITDPLEIEVKHFIDSLTPLRVVDRPGSLVDVGSGAGFPGVPLKIAQPNLQVTLVEATAKKVGFCRHVIEGLGLSGIQAVHARAEELGQQPAHRGQYDWAIGRAVASMAVLAEYLLPLLKVGGTMIAMKGETGPAEAHEAQEALQLLGGHLKQLISFELPMVTETRYLIVVDKVSATPDDYPRRSGMPAKRPLEQTS